MCIRDRYKGTLIFASHDRDLVNKAANKLIIFEEGQISFFHGTLDEHLERTSLY